MHKRMSPHVDKNHIGEANTLINNFKVDKIIINSNRLNYYEKQLPKNKTIIGEEGLTIKLKDFTLVELNTNLDDENDSSGVYLLNYKNINILLTGDASKRSEEYILDNYELPHINILKVGHHGSKTSTIEDFLRVVSPKIALIGVGKDNKFGHPNYETIEKLVKQRIEIYRTDEMGEISIKVNNKGKIKVKKLIK